MAADRASKSLMERFALDPYEIERRSLALVEAAIPSCSGWTSAAREVVKRMVYAAGDLAVAGLARIHPDAVAAALEAIQAGAPIVCDVRMVAAGLRACDNAVDIAVEQVSPVPPPHERDGEGITRAAAGMRKLAANLDGSIAVIGNAPTALLALLDLVDANVCRPALIVGTPVGFVAAAESKQELIARDVPYVTVEGSRGGSPIAAAAMNALLILASR